MHSKIVKLVDTQELKPAIRQSLASVIDKAKKQQKILWKFDVILRESKINLQLNLLKFQQDYQ